MRRLLVGLAALSALVIALLSGQQAAAEKRGGILKLASPANPASMSPMEEATIDAEMPMMGVFNNLILFDQHIPQVSLETIRPDLATEWTWNEDGTELLFKLRKDVNLQWPTGKRKPRNVRAASVMAVLSEGCWQEYCSYPGTLPRSMQQNHLMEPRAPTLLGH